jgi:DNA-binding XRE family transcriptional regulator
MTGAELRATRKRLGMSQASLAAELGVSVSQLHNWEWGFYRGTDRPCPVPRAIELACMTLETSSNGGK